MNSSIGLILVVLVLVVVVAGAVWLYSRRRRSDELREKFGPEYDRTVEAYGASGPAEHALTERSQRVEQLHIRPLAVDQATRYARQWRAVQTQFVDNPDAAIVAADLLVAQVMQARGYPMGDFEQRAADVSVDHPGVVEHYRAAHAIATHMRDGHATTEDMRQAMVHYRFLFDDLIETPATETMEVRR